MVNDDCRVLRDFSVKTDHAIQARRPDMIVKDRRNRHCKIIDFAATYDNRVDNKEAEKMEKHQDLARELKRLCNKQVEIIPVVVRVLGTTLRQLPKRVTDIGKGTRIVDLKKSVILCSARILRKVLEV